MSTARDHGHSLCREQGQCAGTAGSGAATGRRLAEEQNQRERDKRQDHQQHEIVNIPDDLRLRGDGGIERGPPRRRVQAPRMRDIRLWNRWLRSAYPGGAANALDQQDQTPEKQRGAAEQRTETGKIDQ